MRWETNENRIIIPIKKTFLQIVIAISILVLSLYLLGKVIYISLLLGWNNQDFISISFAVLASLGLIISTKDLLMPDKIILTNNFMHILSAPLLYRRYHFSKIEKVDICNYRDISFTEMVGYKCDTNNLCIIQTKYQKHLINLKNTEDIQKIVTWLDNTGND